MVKHMIMWKIKDEFTDEKKQEIKHNAKEQLEGLKGKIPGLLEMQIKTVGLKSSAADLMMDSTFESAEALKEYSSHPEHVKVADNYVRPYMQTRLSWDYEE